jgi:imidazolonepropionase-like amidohydrolase
VTVSGMPHRRPCLLADPPPHPGRTWLADALLFDGTGAAPVPGSAVLVQDGRVVRIGSVRDAAPEGAQVVDLGGRVLLPGLIDAHAHVYADPPVPAEGAEPLHPGVTAHLLAARLRERLAAGVTTLRDVGSYGDQVLTARQAVRYGAFRGPRLLTCGRIVSATSPGGRSFDGMYREADGCDDMRRAVREQLRRGADFVKVMSTGARSVELEDPEPAQLTRAETAAMIDEAHRLGCRVAAHAEGLAGTELAVTLGADTIEHGMYLWRRPDLLDAMAAAGQTLVPTLSCYYGVAGLGDRIGTGLAEDETSSGWVRPLVELAHHNLDEAGRTLRAARAAGVPIALGFDWQPFGNVGLELARMVHHGLPLHEALAAATGGAARALDLAGHVGTVAPGLIADLVVLDAHALDIAVLRDPGRVWRVYQGGAPVAGSSCAASAS